MIEIILLDYLNRTLDVPAYMEVPEGPPERYVVVQKTGSRRANRLDTATFAIQSLAPSLHEAAVLNEEVKTAMESIEDAESAVFRTQLDSDYNFTDTRKKERRYQAVYHITYKE